jgi:ATP-dependent exoDNAse (exonuclease V) beta subunit
MGKVKGANTENIETELEDVSFEDVEAEDTEATTEAEPESTGSKGKKAAKAHAKETKPAKAEKTAKTAKGKTAKPAKGDKAKKVKKAKSDKPKGARTQKSSEKIDPKQALKDGLIKLDDKGRDLPFKAGSVMRECIEQALNRGGVEEKVLEKQVIKLGYDWKFQRAVLVSGRSGDSSLRPYPTTHTWDVEEKNGRIIVSNVKRIAFYKRMARIDGVGKK